MIICKLEKHESTEVTFDELTQDVIDAYVDSGEPTYDKTGGYVKFSKLQEGSKLFKSIPYFLLF